jgi:hypothetical protein
MSDEPLKLEFSDPGSAAVDVKTTEELLTFEYVWENFVAQLNNARATLEEKNTEINEQMNTMTRIDLKEFNDLKVVVTKLEAGLEALDLIRTKVCGEKSLINFEE